MSDTFPDETLYPVLESLADEDRIFASNSAVSHESSQIKGSTIKGLINALKGTPPSTLDTLQKLAAAINNDPAFHATLTTALGLKAPLASPALTGTPTAPTAAMGTKTTQLATTAFVQNNDNAWVMITGRKHFDDSATGNEGVIISRYNIQTVRSNYGIMPASPAGTSTLFIGSSANKYASLNLENAGVVSATTPAAGTNTTQLATTAFVTGALAGAAGVPAGVICMWSGTIATVPTGWALCDGTNGTPDLVDRFVVAAGVKSGGDKYDPGDTGGADDVTLTLTQVPAHTHAGTTGAAGQHRHAAYVPFWGGNAGSSTMIDKRDSAAYNEAQPEQLIYTDYSLDHTHTFTTDSKGGGGSHENRPPYYALAFIMKL